MQINNPQLQKQPSVVSKKITKVAVDQKVIVSDVLAIEEPLEIRIEYGSVLKRLVSTISVTMRTPGCDEDLAIGFLFTEGIITTLSEIESVSHQFIACREEKENTILVKLTDTAIPNLKGQERSFYTTSSCGVCGKGSIEAIRTISTSTIAEDDDVKIEKEILLALPEKLRFYQALFDQTGGLHGCALFDTDGNMQIIREDVGRHNALDKLIGASLGIPTTQTATTVLLLSGRASFELVQKAVMAGIRIIAAVGAPSSLSVELAAEFNVTLIGFLRQDRFNIYNAPQRIIID